MDPQNQNPITNVSPNTPEEKSVGPAIGIIVIIIVIIIGGLYFWGQRAMKQPLEDSTTFTDQNVSDLQKQNSSDDVNSIEADLQSTDLNQLGSELNSIEAGASAQ